MARTLVRGPVDRGMQPYPPRHRRAPQVWEARVGVKVGGTDAALCKGSLSVFRNPRGKTR